MVGDKAQAILILLQEKNKNEDIKNIQNEENRKIK
jgi:hypothetical protein